MVDAFVLIHTKSGKERDVLQALSKIPRVREAHLLYGDYDIVSKLKADSLDHLNEIVLTAIRPLDHVVQTNVLITL